MMECINCKIKLNSDFSSLSYCCDGRFCGCMGLPIDPPLCDKCEEEFLGNDK